MLTKPQIEAELKRRSAAYLGQSHLLVDYYRIRRKIAYPLPITEIYLPQIQIPDLPTYPWSIWMAWALEERIYSLGWTAEYFDDDQAYESVKTDLQALAEWPAYRQLEYQDLCLGHCARLLWTAHTHWLWLEPDRRQTIEGAMDRIVADVLPLAQKTYTPFKTKADILASDEPYRILHNIPTIGLLGTAMLVNTLEHPQADFLNQALFTVLGTVFDLQADGFAEGVAYDGYVLDFVIPWLQSLPTAQWSTILEHPSFDFYLQKSYMLGVPGDLAQVAELSDVEPREMPFHMAAQAKVYAMASDPIRAWYLNHLRLDWLPADALGALYAVADDLADQAVQSPAAGPLNAHYALVLRSGWQSEDLAVTMASSTSPMGHIHQDNGSVVIGHNQKWLITDPGYQQYIKNSEREFTLGPDAHNAPVLNGQAQTRRAGQVLALETTGPDLHHARLDLKSCYPNELDISVAIRNIWLSSKTLVVIADELQGDGLSELAYYWHGHPDVGWWVQDNWARLYTPEATLWLSGPQFTLDETNLNRRSGSRGHLTLSGQIKPPPSVTWWIFHLGETPPDLIYNQTTPNQIQVNDIDFQVP